MTTVAVVENDNVFCDRLTTLLDSEPGIRCAGTFRNAERALEGLPRIQPDVVLLDLNLPKMSGIELIRPLKALVPSTEILMLTVENQAGALFGALEAGASGYLVKPASATEIFGAIRQVVEGGAPMSPEIARLTLSFFRRKGEAKTALAALTSREREVIECVAHGDRSVEIAEQLGISLKTVNIHLHNIYRKLHVTNRTEAAKTFFGFS